MARYDVTPADVGRGRAVPDRELSMLAAHWLVLGHDSPALRELAGLGPSDFGRASKLMERTLAELKVPRASYTFDYDEAEWRGYWGQIEWARDEMGHRLSPYAAAQYVLEVLEDVPELWAPGRGDHLNSLLERWDANATDRATIDDEIRGALGALDRNDVPPLSS